MIAWPGKESFKLGKTKGVIETTHAAQVGIFPCPGRACSPGSHGEPP